MNVARLLIFTAAVIAAWALLAASLGVAERTLA